MHIVHPADNRYMAVQVVQSEGSKYDFGIELCHHYWLQKLAHQINNVSMDGPLTLYYWGP